MFVGEFMLRGIHRGTPESYISLAVRVGNWGFLGIVSGIVSGLFSQIVSPSRFFSKVGSSDLSWRLKFWRSKAGETLARWLRKGTRVKASADRDRPTEILVGAAALSLFEALPRDVRKQLPDVRETLQKLEHRARDLRARRDELEGLARSAGPLRAGGSAALDDARREAVEDLAGASEKVGHQLATTIAALETIRLDLLRLHAGRGSTGDLSAAIAAARAIGDDVDNTLVGRESVERMLSSRGT
jgi:serine/threonine-protein kinase